MKNKIIKLVSLLLTLSIIVIGVLQVINNGIDIRFLIEPFEVNDDILELKRIAKEKVNNNTNSVMILIGLTVINVILRLLLSRKVS